MSVDGQRPQGEQSSTKPKCCLGVLYFSQFRFDHQKPPVCAGLGKNLNPKEEGAHIIATDSIPGGGFRYICMGYSAFDHDALKEAAQKRNSETDPIKLPYCEGLEVLSAAAVNRKPELLTGGPGVNPQPSPLPTSQGGEGDAPTRQRPGRSFVPGGNSSSPQFPEHIDWDQFKERFDKMSKRIIIKMKANAEFMGNALKKGIDEVSKQITSNSSSSSNNKGNTRDPS